MKPTETSRILEFLEFLITPDVKTTQHFLHL